MRTAVNINISFWCHTPFCHCCCVPFLSAIPADWPLKAADHCQAKSHDLLYYHSWHLTFPSMAFSCRNLSFDLRAFKGDLIRHCSSCTTVGKIA